MSTSAACVVAYDDTRTASVTATREGDIIYRARVAHGDADEADASSWDVVARDSSPQGAAVVAVALTDAAHGRIIASASASGDVTFFRVSHSDEGSSLSRVGYAATGTPTGGVAFAPAGLRAFHGPTLAFAGADGVLRLFAPRDASTATDWEEVGTYEGKTPGAALTSVAWRRGGETNGVVDFPVIATTATYSSDREHNIAVNVLAYDVKYARWNSLKEIRGGSLPTRRELTASARCSTWSPTTTARGALDLAIVAGTKCVIYEFTGVTVNSVESAREIGVLAHDYEVNNASWNASGSALATAARDGVVRLWTANLQSGAWQEYAETK